MKKLVIASVIAGAAVAGLLFYLRDQYSEKKTADDITDAADDAYKTADKFIRKEEETFDPALN